MANPEKLHLIRDVLDKLLVDRENVPLGRVDGIVLVVSGEGAQPRVVQIESGIPTLARRLSSRFTRRAHRVSRMLGLRWRRPVKTQWSKIENISRELMLDSCGENSALLRHERWLRDHIIRHIPGGANKQS